MEAPDYQVGAHFEALDTGALVPDFGSLFRQRTEHEKDWSSKLPHGVCRGGPCSRGLDLQEILNFLAK